MHPSHWSPVGLGGIREAYTIFLDEHFFGRKGKAWGQGGARRGQAGPGGARHVVLGEF